MFFDTVYALPNFYVTEADREKYRVSLSQLDEAHAAGKTIAVSLVDTPYGCLDFDDHGKNSAMPGTVVYEAWKKKYPEFFDSTYTERTPSGGYHVFFNKVGPLNGKPFKDFQVDVFDGVKHHWVVIGISRFKNGKPAKYEIVNSLPVLDLPDELREQLLPVAKQSTGQRSLPMPNVVKPLSIEMRFYENRDTGIDWSEFNTGRNQKLFDIVTAVYRTVNTGTDPKIRMGKALWVAEQVLAKASLPLGNSWDVEDWWNDNKSLSAYLDEDLQKMTGQQKPVELSEEEVNHSGAGFVNAMTAYAPPRSYLWEGRIVNNAVNLLAGRQGLGKSTVATEIAARLSRGELPGIHMGTKKSTFIIASEDDTGDTIRPRAYVNGFDPKMELTVFNYDLTADGRPSVPSIDGALARIKQHPRFDEHAFVIIDTPARLMAGGGDTVTNSYKAVTDILTTANAWARMNKKAVLLIWHLNKEGETMGSMAWEGGARCVLRLDTDPSATEETPAALLSIVKANGMRQVAQPLRATLEYSEVTLSGEVHNAAKVNWEEAYKNNREMREDLESHKTSGNVDADLFNYLEENGPSKRAEILQGVGCPPATFTRSLSRLMKQDRVFKSKKTTDGTVEYSLRPFDEPAPSEEPVETGTSEVPEDLVVF